jgi:hypothetical protein
MPDDKEKTIPELEKDLLTGAAEDGGEEGSAPDPKAAKAEEGGDDARLSPDDESNDGEAADDPNDDAETRERRRMERQQRKNRQKLAKARTQQELADARRVIADMAARIEALERGSVGNAKQAHIARANQANNAYLEAEAAIKRAMETNDPEAMTKALRVRDAAKAEYDRAAYAVQQIEQQERQPQTQRRQEQPASAEAAPDPQMVAEYRKFQARNPWYDPTGRDPDSQKAVVIDQALSAEGYDPTEPDYWTELENRLRRAVPHQYEGDDAPPPPTTRRRGNPPVNGNREAGTGNGNRDSGLSKARLDAIREAAGDDPKKFARLVAYAKQYDKSKRPANTSR